MAVVFDSEASHLIAMRSHVIGVCGIGPAVVPLQGGQVPLEMRDPQPGFCAATSQTIARDAISWMSVAGQSG